MISARSRSTRELVAATKMPGGSPACRSFHCFCAVYAANTHRTRRRQSSALHSQPHRAREFRVRLTLADGPVGAAELPEEEEPCS